MTDFQTMAFSLALYLALPFMQITCTPLVFRGVGMRTWNREQLVNRSIIAIKKNLNTKEIELIHLDLLCQQSGFEIGLDDDFDLQLGAPDLADQRDDAERQDDVLRGAIPAARCQGGFY